MVANTQNNVETLSGKLREQAAAYARAEGYPVDPQLAIQAANRIDALLADVEEWKIRYIVAANPGINPEEVRHNRGLVEYR